MAASDRYTAATDMKRREYEPVRNGQAWRKGILCSLAFAGDWQSEREMTSANIFPMNESLRLARDVPIRIYRAS